MSTTTTINGKEIFDLLHDDILAIEEQFGRDTVSNVAVITEIGEYLRAGGGKRIRPALLLLSAKLFKAGEPKTVGKGRGRIDVALNAGISDEVARSLQKKAKQVSPRVQVRIQGDQLRVTSKEKDALQAVIKALREDDSVPVPLQFVNYRP